MTRSHCLRHFFHLPHQQPGQVWAWVSPFPNSAQEEWKFVLLQEKQKEASRGLQVLPTLAHVPSWQTHSACS